MKILIAGGSGLVGSRLTTLLKQEGHEVSHLSRKKPRQSSIDVYEWDVDAQTIEDGALDGVEAIVNLAGAGVADERWTSKRKKLLYDSRINASRCLFKYLKERKDLPEVVITASGKDFYEEQPFGKISVEEDSLGNSFLAGLCGDWEKEAFSFESLGCRTAQLRISMVLDKKGGALAKLAEPIKWGVGAPLGTGKQMMPWIHIDDMCGMIMHILKTPSCTGPYNAASSEAKSNKEFTKAVAKQLNRPLFLPNVPGFVLKMMLGEMSDIVLKGHHISNEKLLSTGFVFKYPTLESALAEIYG